MIRTEKIEHAIRLAIYSPAVKGEKPVSLLLLAPPEHGKSELLKKFAFIPSVRISSDFNSFIFADIVGDYQAGRAKTLVVPDLLRLVKRKYSTQANALSIINAITEEGWIGKLPLGQTVDKPVVMNVIAALTMDELMDKRHKCQDGLSLPLPPHLLLLLREHQEPNKGIHKGQDVLQG